MLYAHAVLCRYFANIPSVFGSPIVPNPRNSIIEMEYTWVFENQLSNMSKFGVSQACLRAEGLLVADAFKALTIDFNCILVQACLRAEGSANPLCFFPEYALAHMRTPLFLLQSGYDSWQTNFIWLTPDGGKPKDAGWAACAQDISTCNVTQLQLVETLHQQWLGKIAPLTNPSTPHGGFVSSCMSHCISGDVFRPIANASYLQTFALWYDGKIAAKGIPAPYSQNGC
jgi:hypothetical protein